MTLQLSDVLVMGGGMVGLCVAHQLLERGMTKSVTLLKKESELGRHSSGRNSGVPHAGLSYKPESVKAKVCVTGARRQRTWAEKRGLPINRRGKVIMPPRPDLDSQLDLLAERGQANGSVVELLDESQLRELIAEACSVSDRPLWSPKTAVVKPITVMQRLKQVLQERGVRLLNGQQGWTAKPGHQHLLLADGTTFHYDHLFNCAGLQTGRVSRPFSVGRRFTLLPFKGLYWRLQKDCAIQPRYNLYPVPDLNVHFLGIHFTPSADSGAIVNISPTVTPAWGHENNRGFQAVEPNMAASNLAVLTRQYLQNRGGLRRYMHEQAFLALPPLLLRAAQQLIPAIRAEHLELSVKVSIRSRLFNRNTQRLEDDFLGLPGRASTHVLNAMSAHFNASFALVDLILDTAAPGMNLL